MSDAYDFLSELLKLTEYGDISNSSFTARWIKTNKSLMSYNCMSYFRRYISDQNYVTESEFQKYVSSFFVYNINTYLQPTCIICCI